MTKEQEEAIEWLNRFKTIKVLYGNTFAMTLGQLKTLQGDIETVLNMIKDLQRENIQKDKQIDLMLEKINNNYFNIFSGNENNEIRNIYEKNKDTSKLIGRSLRKACIKQYFERKCEG